MNNPSPLVPQGSFLEQKNKSRARVRLAVFVVLTVHVIGLVALLMQGCRRPPEPEPANTATNDLTPIFEPTNAPEVAAPVDTNVPAYPPVVQESNTYVPAPVQPIAPAATGQTYTVVKGDSFYTIAKKFGVTMRQIQDANPTVQPTRLRVGQTIQIPAPTAAAPTTSSTPAVESSSGGAQTYKVKSGDNLIKIARQFGVTVRALRAENNLTTDRITVGQTLKIPAKAESVPTTTVPPATPVPPVPETAPATTPVR